MTLKELSQLYWLNREVERDMERLDRLRAEAYSIGAAPMDAMPHDSEPSRVTEVRALTVAALEEMVTEKLVRIQEERRRLMEYINGIEDSLTREIYTLRFVDGLSWQQVAASVGGNTADSVKKTCYRYMRKHK